MNSVKGFLLCALLLCGALVCGAQSYEWQWATQAGGISDDNGRAIATDSQGNSYVTGNFDGNNTFGSTTLISNGAIDIFIAKLDNAGNWLWAKKAGGTGNDYGRDICIDTAGNVYLTGYFYSNTASFGATTLTNTASGYPDIFVASLDSNGNWRWAKKAGGINSDYGRGIAIDGTANIYLTGHFTGTASFGSLTLTGSDDAFIKTFA